MSREDAVAKALFEIRDDPYDTEKWEEIDSSERELFDCQARAALAAADLWELAHGTHKTNLNEETEERVARAICAAEFPQVPPAYAWNVQFEDGQRHYREMARAALAAATGEEEG